MDPAQYVLQMTFIHGVKYTGHWNVLKKTGERRYLKKIHIYGIYTTTHPTAKGVPMFLIVSLLIGVSGLTYAMRRLGPFMLAAATFATLGWPIVWLWSVISGAISFHEGVEATLRFTAGFDVINSQVCGGDLTGSGAKQAMAWILLIPVFVLGVYAMLLPFAAIWAAIGAPVLVSAKLKNGHLDFEYNSGLRIARRGVYFLCSTYIALLTAGVLVRIASNLEPMIWTAHC